MQKRRHWKSPRMEDASELWKTGIIVLIKENGQAFLQKTHVLHQASVVLLGLCLLPPGWKAAERASQVFLPEVILVRFT